MGVNPAKAKRAAAFSYSVERLPSGCRLYRLTLRGTPSEQETFRREADRETHPPGPLRRRPSCSPPVCLPVGRRWQSWRGGIVVVLVALIQHPVARLYQNWTG